MNPPALTWERYFSSLPDDVQNTLLHQAALSNGVNLAELPPRSHGKECRSSADRVFTWLGPTATDKPGWFDAQPIAGTDRSPEEVRVLSAILGCPDLFLLDASAGSEQLNLAGIVAWEAVQTGDRVLIVVPTPQQADSLLAQLVDHLDLPIGRAVAPFEQAERLPPASASRTAFVHGEAALQEARTETHRKLTEGKARRAAIQTAYDQLSVLRAAVVEWDEVAKNHTAIEQDRDDLQERLREEMEGIGESPLAQAQSQKLEAHSSRLAQIQHDLEKARLDQDAWNAAYTEAKTHQETLSQAGVSPSGGLFTKLTRLFKSDDSEQKLSQAETQLTEIEAKLQTLAADHDRLQAELDRCRSDFQNEQDRCRAEETARREAELERRREELQACLDRLNASLDAGRKQIIGVGCDPFEAVSPETLDRVEAQLAEMETHSNAECAWLHQWADDLKNRESELTERLFRLVKIVIAPFAALPHDPFTQPTRAGSPPAFDRLIITDADQMGRSEFHSIANLASRWLLIGDLERPPANASRSRPLPPPMFHQFWQRLRNDSWLQDGSRLVVELAAAETPHRWVEPVADQPSIELHFAMQADGEPAITAVSFPTETPISEAIAYLASELGELRLRVSGPIHWHRRESGWTACWPTVEAGGSDWLEPSPGLRLLLAGEGATFRLAVVQFDADAGWTEESAEDWVAENAAPPRTASLAGCPLAMDSASSQQLVGAHG